MVETRSSKFRNHDIQKKPSTRRSARRKAGKRVDIPQISNGKKVSKRKKPDGFKKNGARKKNFETLLSNVDVTAPSDPVECSSDTDSRIKLSEVGFHNIFSKLYQYLP